MKFLNRWFFQLIAYWAIILKKHDIAADYMVRAAALKPTDPRPLTTAASCMNACGRNAEAEALLRRAVDVAPGYAAAWFNLGFLLQKRQQHEEALACFDQAIQHDDKMDRAHYGRALSLVALGRHEEAKAALERTIDLQPMSPYGYYQLASLHHKLGDDKACIKLVRKLHKFEPQLAVQLQRETGVQAGVQDPFSSYRR
jgi:tetratricopeptide (TPR) repeat protein